MTPREAEAEQSGAKRVVRQAARDFARDERQSPIPTLLALLLAALAVVAVMRNAGSSAMPPGGRVGAGATSEATSQQDHSPTR